MIGLHPHGATKRVFTILIKQYNIEKIVKTGNSITQGTIIYVYSVSLHVKELTLVQEI